jgi:transcriptional regulator with XRE-family HTH domain
VLWTSTNSEAVEVRPGQRLKDIRSHLGITTRDVTERSQRIAEAESNDEFYISNAWLTQIENTEATPSIYKLYSMSAIYHIKFMDLLVLFGLDLPKIAKYQLSAPPDQTQLTSMESTDSERSITFPAQLSESLNLDQTNLLSRMVETWGEIPIGLVQHLNIRNDLYGYIGLRDYMLFPLIRPGAFVHIDPRFKKIKAVKWRSEFDRPIYFVELRDGYACSWCELQSNKLLLVPHPLSPCGIRQFIYGTDAEIIGQVTGVAMRLRNGDNSPADETPELPRQS